MHASQQHAWGFLEAECNDGCLCRSSMPRCDRPHEECNAATLELKASSADCVTAARPVYFGPIQGRRDKHAIMHRLQHQTCPARTSVHRRLCSRPKFITSDDADPHCSREHPVRPELLPPDASGARPIVSAYGADNQAMKQHAARARRSHRAHIMDTPPFDPVQVDSSRLRHKPIRSGYRKSMRGSQLKPKAPPSDRDILDELFRVTGGQRWFRRRGWTDDDLARREGVKVDTDGRVTGLELAANNLMGSLPPSLGLLTRLQTLQLQHNKLCGVIPPQIFDSLSCLVAVSMHHNALSGPLPAALFWGKAALKYVHLAFNRFSGMLPLPELPRTEDYGSEQPPVEAVATALEQLHVQSNSFGCGAPLPWERIGALRKLRVLNVANNNFSLQGTGRKVESLSECVHLRLLDISGNDSDNHGASAACQELRILLQTVLHPSCAVLVTRDV